MTTRSWRPLGFGSPMRVGCIDGDGIQAYFDMVNSEGGIYGRKLTIAKRHDDQLTNNAITEWSTKSPPGDVSRTWFTRPNRPVGQVMEVQSVSGTTVTFTTPFHIDFQTAFTAQLSRFSNVDNGARVICKVAIGPSLEMRTLSKRSRMRT